MARDVTDYRDLHFSFQERVLPAVALYGLAIGSLLPGAILGSSILLLWYATSLAFVIQRRPDRLVTMFVIWNFLNRGAYHYGLIGPSESDVLLRSFNSFLLLLMGVAYVFDKHVRAPSLSVYLRFGAALTAISLLSAIVNGVGLFDYIQYYLIYFRWLIFAFLFWNLNLSSDFLRGLVVMIFVIIGANSVFGFLQAYVLPVQVTPSGYIPFELDVASGFLGVTLSQHLTVLCLASASYFAFNYIQDGGKWNALVMGVMLIQPFSSESKFVMLMSTGLFSLSALTLLFGKHLRVPVKILLPKIFLLAVVGVLGVMIYTNTTGETLMGPVAGYSESISSLEDVQKLMGYVIVSTDVAPGGRLGSFLGVGPTKFLNTVGGEDTEYSHLLKIGTEENDVSSLLKQNTEAVATIGELGWIGFAVFVAMIFRIIVDCVKRLKADLSSSERSFVLLEGQLIVATAILTFYLQGWSVAFYYVPIIVFLGFDAKCLQLTRVSAEVTGVSRD